MFICEVMFALIKTFSIPCSIQAMSSMLCAKRFAKYFSGLKSFFRLRFLANSSFWKREEIQDGSRANKPQLLRSKNPPTGTQTSLIGTQTSPNGTQ